jgi:hypothetical protein
MQNALTFLGGDYYREATKPPPGLGVRQSSAAFELACFSKAPEDWRTPRRKRIRSSLLKFIQGYSSPFNPIQGVLRKKRMFISMPWRRATRGLRLCVKGKTKSTRANQNFPFIQSIFGLFWFRDFDGTNHATG